MSRRVIPIDTLTRHFITFSKMMGIFPKIALRFKDLAKWGGVDFYEKRSFYEYVKRNIAYSNRILNEYSIRNIYFYELYPFDKTDYEKCSKSVRDSEVLVELFMSYLKDKKVPRYIKIID